MDSSMGLINTIDNTNRAANLETIATTYIRWIIIM